MAIASSRPAPTVDEVFAHGEWLAIEDYNFRHFRLHHLALDAANTVKKSGPRPGDWAPDFELPCSDGGALRLSELRGKPVLLHFGSFT